MADRVNMDDFSELEQSDGKTLPSIVRYWVLHLLVEFDAEHHFITRHGIRDEAFAREVGLAAFVDDESAVEFDLRKARMVLRQQYRAAQKNIGQVPAQLAQNVDRIASLVGLSEVDVKIFEFAVLMHSYPTFKDVCYKSQNLRSRQMADRLASLLNLPSLDVWEALRPNATLARTGLIAFKSAQAAGSLCDRLELLSEQLADRLVETDVEPAQWLHEKVRPGEPSELQWRDYEHVNKPLSVLRPYLRHAVEHGKQGVNIFLYGPPGTGKTQLVRLLAQDMGVELFEVATEDEDNDPITGRTRVKALCVANSFFAKKSAIVLFDEVEEVFNETNDHSAGILRFLQKQSWGGGARKGWLNRVLETNALPTVWVANSKYGIDPAMMRRFDVVMELPVPPRSHRERIIRETAHDVLDASTVSCLAQSDRLAPAVLSRAVDVVQAIRSDLSTATSDAVHMLINSTLQAQGHRAVRANSPDALPDCYDPAFIHADADLAEVAHMLKTARTGRLCLYGPPGTGKTAFGRWLAEQLSVPLHVRRASDLLGMYVGESEKNIANAFAEAQADGGVLLIDEVDSFLQNRQGAQRSWEVSQVNEMLTQMESFAGIFIASTNLMDQLDPAVQRRFDLKVRFDPLRGSQAAELLTRYCQAQGLPAPDARELSQVQSLTLLTPGDFAAVKRQGRLRPIQSPADWVKALQAECSLKPRAKSSGMGFI